jgi:hypothetical protein
MTEPQPLNNDTEHFAIVKANLDLAWEKVENGRKQETDGRKLWMEGTFDFINILHEERQRYPSDQAFGKRLTDIGYGENRITRQDRSALLNMALHPDATREVLEQTHRRSWRHIWEEEIQLGLPHVGQPAEGENAVADLPDGESTEEAPTADDNKPEALAVTRRPKRNGAQRQANRVQKPAGLRDVRGWHNQKVTTVNGLTDEITKVMENWTPEQRKLLATVELTLLLEATKKLEKKVAELVDAVDTPLEEASDELKQQGRVVVTPAPKRTRHASGQQPEA